MSPVADAQAVTDDRWVDDLMGGADPCAAPSAGSVQSDDPGAGDANLCAAERDLDGDPEHSGDEQGAIGNQEDPPNTHPGATVAAEIPAVDLDAAPSVAADRDGCGPASADAGSKRTAVVLGAGLVVAVAGIVAALLAFSDTAAPAPDQDTSVAAVPAAQPLPVPTSAAPTVPQDQSIPFSASAPCAPGSTSAQSLTDTASDSAWVCARGSRDEALEGKILTVDFGKSYMVSGVEVTPGWVAKTPGGQDRWLQHRVVTRLQYIFLNGNVVSDIFTQDTGTTHGPVAATLPRRVLASRVNVVVLQTSRPPSSPMPASDPGSLPEAQPGLVESLLGEGGAPLSEAPQDPQPYPDLSVPDNGSDPVDNTFAMSALKFLGYQP